MKLLRKVFSKNKGAKSIRNVTASTALAAHAKDTAIAYAPQALGSAAMHASRHHRSDVSVFQQGGKPAQLSASYLE